MKIPVSTIPNIVWDNLRNQYNQYAYDKEYLIDFKTWIYNNTTAQLTNEFNVGYCSQYDKESFIFESETDYHQFLLTWG